MKWLGKLLLYTLCIGNLLLTGGMLLVAYSPRLHPVSHPLLSSIGLTFPFFVIANLLYLFFWWGVEQFKISLLSLAGLILCFSDIRTLCPIHLIPSDVPKESIKLLSYNVMGFNGCEKKNGRNEILSYLVNSDADIICLQEYATSGDAKQHLTQKDVDKALKEYPYKALSMHGKRGHKGLACYSKFPILSAKAVSYKSSYNGSAVYWLKIGNDTVTLINNHLESNKLTKQDKVVYEELLKAPEKEKMKSGVRQLLTKLAEASALRSKQAEEIARQVKMAGDRPVLVCGDFNDIPLSYTYHTIRQDILNDAFEDSGTGPGISYNQHHFYFRIDHILTSRHWEAYDCTVDRSIKESDHYPIWSKLLYKE